MIPSLATIEKNLGGTEGFPVGDYEGDAAHERRKDGREGPVKVHGRNAKGPVVRGESTASAHAWTAVKKASGEICTPLGIPVVPDV